MSDDDENEMANLITDYLVRILSEDTTGSKNKKAKINSEGNNRFPRALIVYDDGGGRQAEQKVEYRGMLHVVSENRGISGQSIWLDAMRGCGDNRRPNRERPKG
ncbi:hypothetical protein FXO38_18101 [Capsicum annuum]|uniref:Uncharacterized protein n=1 Tax=Capsicum annuum TaxID=4072 RepID=A0A2G3AKC4_CAPAN|nr:hypothetical protein FXO38_18101 [Capsicum annuum]KAF3685410.1 hypothetical protein FXO37_00647 [Capsicum annuum]PHT94687.1 hypothetical protein T459_02569 [Capsicum annuum]